MKRLLLVDLSACFWSAYHATADQELSAAFEKTIAQVHRLREGFDYCAVCVDSPPYERKKLYDAYKSNREPHPPLALEQFERTKRRLVADGCLLWAVPGAEADDVICSAVARAIADGLTVVIASSDKDLASLIDDKRYVSLMSLATGQHIDEAACREKFGVYPVLIPELLALWGDASDGIPGVPGVGVKTAAKLLELHGPTVDDVIYSAEDIKSERIRNAVLNSADTIRLARKLVTLRHDLPIEWAELYKERKTERLIEEDTMSDIDDAEFDEEREAIKLEAPTTEVVEKKEPKPDALAMAPSNGHGVQAFEQGLQPGSLGAAYKLAKGLYESRLYSRFPNPEAIWAIVIRGRELGLGALTALDNFHIVENKPVASAHLLIARAKSHPDCDYLQLVGGDSNYAEAETKNKRAPKPTRLRYTIEQAKRAGLVRNGSNWEKRPEEMLRKTVMVQLARVEYPSATAGLYCAEEMGE